jgi:histidine ammonia-lyase
VYEISIYRAESILQKMNTKQKNFISGVVPDITSKGSIGSDGAIALLEMIKNPEKFFGKK